MFDRYETKVVFTYPHADDTGLFWCIRIDEYADDFVIDGVCDIT